MSSAIDPLLTFAADNPDFGWSDELAEIRMLAQRNAMLQRFVDGVVDLEDYLDCLASQGLDPYGWVDMAIDNMEYVIQNGILFEEIPGGLLLPAHS